MREIKFRAWDKKNKRFISPFFVRITGFGKIWILSENLDYVLDEENNIEITQFTGLCDKNGKEIYEEDIVKTKIGIGYVFNRLGCWFVEFQKELGYFSSSDIEVIGNIYENPELLENKEE